MTERITVHLDELEESLLSNDPREQPYDRWVGNCAVANGCFDGLHPGHLTLLAYLDTLSYDQRLRPLVAINSDQSVRRLKGSGRPIWPQDVRARLINHLKWPLTVIIFEEDTPQRLMDLLKPRIVLKGSEYSAQSVVRWQGNEYSSGSEVITVPMIEGWSTTRLVGDTR